MDINIVKKMVVNSFKDYHNENYIREMVNKLFPEVKKLYSQESNISEEIYTSMLLNNRIYYELLKSDNEEDMLYIMEKCKKVINTIKNVKKRQGKDITYIKDELEVYDFCKENYNGSESFISYISQCADGYYNGFDDEINKKEIYNSIEIEKQDIEVLQTMQKYEKKLKFKF